MSIARHAHTRRPVGRLIGPVAALLAVLVGGVLFGLAELHGTSATPAAADGRLTTPAGTPAAALPLVTGGPGTSPAAGSSTAAPSRSAHRSSRPTPSTTARPSASNHSAPALALRPTVISSSTARSSTAAHPAMARLVLAVPMPPLTLAGAVQITMPQHWTILGVRASGGAKRVSGDGVHGGVWQVNSGPVSVTVTGPSGSDEVMSVHVSSLLGSANETFRLN